MANLDAMFIDAARHTGKVRRLSLFREAVVAGGIVKVMITNPATSKTNAVFYASSIISSITAVATMEVFRGTDTAPPTNAPTGSLGTNGSVANMNAKYSSLPSALTIKYDNNAVLGALGAMTTGKVDDSPVLTNAGLTNESTAFELPPGYSIAIQWSGAAMDFAYKLFWVEVQA